jgi:outer membrane scaffolding protein for murein synthesis (MipA/OmpV family)
MAREGPPWVQQQRRESTQNLHSSIDQPIGLHVSGAVRCAALTLALVLAPDAHPAVVVVEGPGINAPQEPDGTAEVRPAEPADEALLPPLRALFKDVDGAIGASVSYGPDFRGASSTGFGWKPVFYLRIGKVSISSGTGFVTKQADDVVSGIAADLIKTERTRLGLSLRTDRGRDEDSSEELRGLGDTPDSLRLRATVRHQITSTWRATAAWSIDALGRGKGGLGEATIAWDHALGAGCVLSLAGGLSFADATYMQMNFGVTAEQAVRSGYAVYEPSAGMRDVSASASVRGQLAEHFWGTIGLGLSRLVGPPISSPYTSEPFAWGVNTSVAWGF